MHIEDQALELDREIRRGESATSELVEAVLNALKECEDTLDIDRQIFDLSMHLLELRVRRACLYGAHVRTDMHHA